MTWSREHAVARRTVAIETAAVFKTEILRGERLKVQGEIGMR